MNHAPPRVERDLSLFLDWFVQLKTDRFDVAVQRRGIRGRNQFLAPKHTGHRNWDQTRIHNLLPWLRAENAQGADIYIRAHSESSWPVVFLDDIPTPLARRIAGKYSVNLIETSPGRTHLWLNTDIRLNRDQRTYAQRFLVRKLHGLADNGSVSGDH